MQIEADPVPQIRSQVPAIRPATNADRKQVALLLLEREEFKQEPGVDSDLDDIEATYSSPSGGSLVFVEDDRLTAIGSYRRIDPQSVELIRLRVACSHRQRGLGRKLLRALIESAQGEGYKQMVLELSKEMEEARCLVASEGFRLERKGDFLGTTLYFYKKAL